MVGTLNSISGFMWVLNAIT